MVRLKSVAVEDKAAEIHRVRRDNFRERMNKAAKLKHQTPVSRKWRNLRWGSILLVNGLFWTPYWLDNSFIKGSLVASHVFGILLLDPYATLEYGLANRGLSTEMLLGAGLVILFYLLVGGRSFCSWVCPYTLLLEWSEPIHVRLRKKRWIRNHTFNPKLRYFLWGGFLLLAFLTGVAPFETINVMAILHRAVVYGPGLAVFFVLAVLVVDTLVMRQGWCRYLCPVGLTYSFIGRFAVLRVRYTLDGCHHDGACRSVCPSPEMLDITKAGHAPSMFNHITDNCTRCGRCIDVCPTNSLGYALPILAKRRYAAKQG